ncbi:MAG TPA: adenylate/guanylate cyclase domain-containing protein [Chitinophagales bacterium]|nr:adenylate/guanylate cyclase domain-containing protein [Chitinophagales bacterium]
MSSVRQLAAIMFTDIEGYTALMNKDEQAAMERRQRHREVFEKTTTDYEGKILQYYGDGTLSIFSSAVNAVSAAVEMQKQFLQSPHVPLRIGIHLGDINYDDSGVYGDGVNIASRIESLAVSGAVFVSDKVSDEIRNHPLITTVSMGAFELKNVSRPVEVFAVSSEGLTVPHRAELKGKTAEPKNKLAVLPFVNMSNDPDNEYFSDGIAEELINALTKIDGLQVTSRTSSFTFKGKNQDVREIGRTLDVGKVLEGSVRKAGNRVRITAQLINAADGYHLWSETFDRNLDDIFQVQDEISGIIANKLREQFSARQEAAEEPVSNMEAYQLYLKGLFYFNKGTPDDFRKAIDLFEQAVALEPTFANAWAMISSTYSELTYHGNANYNEVIEKVKKASQRAIELDSNHPQAYLSTAMMELYFEFNFENAWKNIRKAMDLSPNSSEVHYVASHYFMVINDKKRMVEEAELALQTDPLSLMKNNHLGEAMMSAERLDEAEKQFEKTLEMDPKWRTPLRNLALIALGRGEYEKCLEIFEQIRMAVNQPGKGVTGSACALGLLGRKEEALVYVHQLEERNKADSSITLEGEMAIIYAGMGEMDIVFQYLNAAFEKRGGNLFFSLRYPLRTLLIKDQRYWQVLEKMGLRKYYESERTL